VSLSTFDTLVRAAGFRLAVLDTHGHELARCGMTRFATTGTVAIRRTSIRGSRPGCSGQEAGNTTAGRFASCPSSDARSETSGGQRRASRSTIPARTTSGASQNMNGPRRSGSTRYGRHDQSCRPSRSAPAGRNASANASPHAPVSANPPDPDLCPQTRCGSTSAGCAP
jgi:hypothetical protein